MMTAMIIMVAEGLVLRAARAFMLILLGIMICLIGLGVAPVP